MERLEIPVTAELEARLDALEGGDEVVFVREGKAVANAIVQTGRPGPLDRKAVAALQAAMAPLRVPGVSGAQLVRDLRDASDH